MASKKKLLQLLKALIEVVESSSEEEILALKTTLGQVVRKPVSSKLPFVEKKTAPRVLAAPKRLDIERAADALSYVRSREEALALLERFELNKQSLEHLARRLEVSVVREDNSRRLMEKIVERSIGSRLNSEAIRGSATAR